MPLTAAQICTRAAQIARVPGFLQQAGDSLNVVLQELCQDYDFQLTRKTYQFNFNTSQINSLGQAYQDFPADFLRAIRNECWYFISGVPYPMIPLDLSEFDMLVQQSGVSNFPIFFYVSMADTPPRAYFWMPPSGAYGVVVKYYSQMPDIANASTSTAIPWFPNQQYLITRVAGELMRDADDERAASFLGDNDETAPLGAGTILRKYLQMKDNKGDRAQVVELDRRRFGRSFDRLKNTKQIGW
jgi:hypothetical protein